MSEENKNRNKDKGKQDNVRKYDKKPENFDVEIAEDSEFLNLDKKRNKRRRK